MADRPQELLTRRQRSAASEAWYAQSSTDAADRLGVETHYGLNDQEARTRLVQYGPNLPGEERPLSFWKVFLEEVREPMILLLLATGILYSLWGNLSDALTIFAVILILVGAEVYNEYRAKKAIAALSKLAEPTAAVWRNERYQEIPVEQVVPGDVVLLQAGRRVYADARLLESSSLAADEAPLTGEAFPVEKEAAVILPPKTPLAA
jgi:P-type Ca2+ transporter type 2C